MAKQTDIRVAGVEMYFLPVQTRVPLKFGLETLTEVICARVRVTVRDRAGRSACGWGETPLSVQWAWPSSSPYALRCSQSREFCLRLAQALAGFAAWGHPMEVSHDFQEQVLPALRAEFNGQAAAEAVNPPTTPLRDEEEMPWLAALVCFSAFDLALHDAFGKLLNRPVYETYSADHLNRSLADFMDPAEKSISFAGRYPTDYLRSKPERKLPAWHLVGGLDPLDESELTGKEPADGYPVLLEDWIRRDGLTCLKIKLRGNDELWDFERMAKVGAIALRNGVLWLSADFNCTVRDPAYVTSVLDRFQAAHPDIFRRILYIEQPFPYDLEQHCIPVYGVSQRKPLFLDESAHDWKLVRVGRELGWTGVALKTCKTQTGAILSGCWARAHGMSIMVQDLTNPMLAQIPHVLLAAHVGTIMGVETNAMQFYPEASNSEAKVHPGLYRRREGCIDLSTIAGPGFGYRLDEIRRELPRVACAY